MSAASLLSESIRLAVAFLLLFAAFTKLANISEFRRNLVESFSINETLSYVLAALVVMVEIVLGISIALETALRQNSLYAALGVFVVFTATILYKYLTKDVVKCSCFGESERPVSRHDLTRNIIIVGSLAACLLASDGAVHLPADQRALAASMAIVWAVLISQFHQIMTLMLHTSDGSD